MKSGAEGRRAVEAYLALGSNLGDRAAHLAAGVARLATRSLRVTAVSPVFETPPWGPVPQGPYLNACARIETRLSPRGLLRRCLAVERSEGRERTTRWGPRTLDIDILAYGDRTVDEPDLKIPHPRLMERAFVLVPLVALAPDLVVGGVPVATALERLDRSGIVPWAGAYPGPSSAS